jgi:hypothetical protein
MIQAEFPHDIKEEDKLDYRKLQLVISVMSEMETVWKMSIQKILSLFEEHQLYQFIGDNYGLYHGVGTPYILADIKEYIGQRGKQGEKT